MKRAAILILSLLFTGLFIGSGYAGVEPSPFHEKGFDSQPEPPGVYKPIQPSKSVDTKQFPAIRLEDTKIMEQPSIKRSLNIGVKPLHVVQKPDLTCTIKAFHDANRTKPVQGGVWHLNSYHPSHRYPTPTPTPWYVYFDIEVKNIGWKDSGPTRLIIQFTAATGKEYFYKLYVSRLPSGEEHIYRYYWGPFPPSPYSEPLYNKNIAFQAIVDEDSNIDEISETNNRCRFDVKFVAP